MKLNRLLEITILLLNRGTVTAKELAQRFGVSKRTIYRDIDVLSSAGVPVFTNKGHGGGISLMEDYSLNKAMISENESESMLLALKTLQATKYPEVEAVLNKLGALFHKAGAADWVHIDYSPWSSSPNERNRLVDIKRGILERRVVSFDYVDSDGKRSTRQIEPMQMIYKGQAWYLWGYCRARQDYRIFRVSRIKNVILNEETFTRRQDDGGYQSYMKEIPPNQITLKLRFQPQVLNRLYDDFNNALIIRNRDGTCTVTVNFPEDEWVYGYLLSYGHFVEVLEPPHIRRILAERMKKALEFYHDDQI